MIDRHTGNSVGFSNQSPQALRLDPDLKEEDLQLTKRVHAPKSQDAFCLLDVAALCKALSAEGAWSDPAPGCPKLGCKTANAALRYLGTARTFPSS